jgi:hypothetical protein
LRAWRASDARHHRRSRRFWIGDSEFKPRKGIVGYGPV